MKITKKIYEIWACRTTTNGRRYSNCECWFTYCLEEEIPAVLEYLKEEHYKNMDYDYRITNRYDGDYYSYNKEEKGYVNIGSCKGFKSDLYAFMTEEDYKKLRGWA